jgi:hypothetical protein
MEGRVTGSLRQAVSHYEAEPELEARMPARAPGATAPRGQFASLLPAAHGVLRSHTRVACVDDWWKLWLAAPPASQRS